MKEQTEQKIREFLDNYEINISRDIDNPDIITLNEMVSENESASEIIWTNICNIIEKEEGKEDTWIFIEEDNLPEIGTEFLLKNEKWINEDYNPLGIRLGFRSDLIGWVSSYYCNEHDEYHTRYSDEDNYDFELSKGVDQIPTHYKKIK